MSLIRIVRPLLLFLFALLAQDPPRHVERVEVARVLVDARAVDQASQPLLGLTADNFRVRIDGKPARVESAQWVAGALASISTGADPRDRFFQGSASPATEGRLVVLLFQKSFEKSRIVGLMRMLLDLRPFLDGFTRHDRLAVLSFDTRLRVWLDFTADMDRVREVLTRNVLFDAPATDTAAEGPSLREGLRGERAERTYQIESALGLLAAALRPLPGAKTVVFVGHGFGRLSLGGVVMENNYEEAREALQDARATVFCLDVTTADYHSLEAGLRMVSRDTGGFYERAHIFGQRALARLGAALAGHYVLLVEKPDVKPGRHRIDVKLKGRAGTVYARNAFTDE